MKKVRFSANGDFTTTLHARIENYFTTHNKAKTGDHRLFLKTALILLLMAGSYITLLLNNSLTITVIAAVVLSQSMVMVGFNIMHDANHDSYSGSKEVNVLAGFMLDLIGASSYLWKHKHNYLHHTFTNISGLDTDLETSGIIRLSPQQEWKPFHRFQILYALPLYSILTLYWFLFNDFVQFFQGRIGSSKTPKKSAGTVAVFLGFKLFYIFYMLILPMQFHHWSSVLLVFLGIHLMASFTISLVFQLAHTLEDNEFPSYEESDGHAGEWSIHQIQTTANFAHRNRFITWYLGGLNYQTEHHLFPKISHVHYSALSDIVAEVCREFNVEYVQYPSTWKAVVSHGKFLWSMGAKP